MPFTQQELNQLKVKFSRGALTQDEMTDILDHITDLQKVVNDWYGFLTQMAKVSSWSSKIQEKLDAYDFGTTDKKVIEAAKQYLARLEQRETITTTNGKSVKFIDYR